jgi:hypothetical protein
MSLSLDPGAYQTASFTSFTLRRNPLRIGSKLSELRGKEVLKATLETGLIDGWIVGWREAVYECKDNADQVTFGSI